MISDKLKLNLSPEYLKTEKDKLRIELYEEEMLKQDTPFIFFQQNTKFNILPDIHLWFYSQLRLIFPETKYNILNKIISDKAFLNDVNQIFNKLDTGVKSISFLTRKFDEIYKYHEDYDDLKSYYRSSSFYARHVLVRSINTMIATKIR